MGTPCSSSSSGSSSGGDIVSSKGGMQQGWQNRELVSGSWPALMMLLNTTGDSCDTRAPLQKQGAEQHS
jgi:hypothetical protein